jgi:sugar lactone lactonase YvrE
MSNNKSKTSNKWTVTNVYGIAGETTHRTPEAALKECYKREGSGWIVVDADGNQWIYNWSGKAVLARE